MLNFLLNEMNFDEQINYLKSIETTLSCAETIKKRLKAEKRWNVAYVWQYPNYRFTFAAEEWKTKAYYKEGYHDVWHPSTTLYTYGGGSTTNSEYCTNEHIPGSGSELKYFYPNREMYTEFSNIQNVYKNTLRCLIINTLVTTNKKSLIKFFLELLRCETKFPLFELADLNQADIDILLNKKDRIFKV